MDPTRRQEEGWKTNEDTATWQDTLKDLETMGVDKQWLLDAK